MTDIIINCDVAKREFRTEKGEKVSLSVVKDLWETGSIADYNLSLRSLANCDWNWEHLERYYAEMDG